MEAATNANHLRELLQLNANPFVIKAAIDALIAADVDQQQKHAHARHTRTRTSEQYLLDTQIVISQSDDIARHGRPLRYHFVQEAATLEHQSTESVNDCTTHLLRSTFATRRAAIETLSRIPKVPLLLALDDGRVACSTCCGKGLVGRPGNDSSPYPVCPSKLTLVQMAYLVLLKTPILYRACEDGLLPPLIIREVHNSLQPDLRAVLFKNDLAIQTINRIPALANTYVYYIGGQLESTLTPLAESVVIKGVNIPTVFTPTNFPRLRRLVYKPGDDKFISKANGMLLGQFFKEGLEELIIKGDPATTPTLKAMLSSDPLAPAPCRTLHIGIEGIGASSCAYRYNEVLDILKAFTARSQSMRVLRISTPTLAMYFLMQNYNSAVNFNRIRILRLRLDVDVPHHRTTPFVPAFHGSAYLPSALSVLELDGITPYTAIQVARNSCAVGLHTLALQIRPPLPSHIEPTWVQTQISNARPNLRTLILSYEYNVIENEGAYITWWLDSFGSSLTTFALNRPQYSASANMVCTHPAFVKMPHLVLIDCRLSHTTWALSGGASPTQLSLVYSWNEDLEALAQELSEKVGEVGPYRPVKKLSLLLHTKSVSKKAYVPPKFDNPSHDWFPDNLPRIWNPSTKKYTFAARQP